MGWLQNLFGGGNNPQQQQQQQQQQQGMVPYAMGSPMPNFAPGQAGLQNLLGNQAVGSALGAYGTHGAWMQNAMGQISDQLNANANRVGANRRDNQQMALQQQHSGLTQQQMQLQHQQQMAMNQTRMAMVQAMGRGGQQPQQPGVPPMPQMGMQFGPWNDTPNRPTQVTGAVQTPTAMPPWLITKLQRAIRGPTVENAQGGSTADRAPTVSPWSNNSSPALYAQQLASRGPQSQAALTRAQQAISAQRRSGSQAPGSFDEYDDEVPGEEFFQNVIQGSKKPLTYEGGIDQMTLRDQQGDQFGQMTMPTAPWDGGRPGSVDTGINQAPGQIDSPQIAAAVRKRLQGLASRAGTGLGGGAEQKFRDFAGALANRSSTKLGRKRRRLEAEHVLNSKIASSKMRQQYMDLMARMYGSQLDTSLGNYSNDLYMGSALA